MNNNYKSIYRIMLSCYSNLYQLKYDGTLSVFYISNKHVVYSYRHSYSLRDVYDA
jgi:hypothetical protein